MPTTTRLQLPYPDASAPDDVPTDLFRLAQRLDTVVGDLLPPAEGQIRIGDRTYQTSGLWPSVTLGSPAVSGGGTYAWTASYTLPVDPPSGWTYIPFQVASDGFTVVARAGLTGRQMSIRVLSVASQSPTIRLGWQLVYVGG